MLKKQAIPAEEIESPFIKTERLRVLDARRTLQFEEWDVERERIAACGQIVVLLDVASSDRLLQQAPHFATWAGGVRLPAESGVRGVQTNREFEVGKRLLSRKLAENPEISGGQLAIELASSRIFRPRWNQTALEVAQDRLDQGIVYVEEVDDRKSGSAG
jgi:hypothetical protein